MYEERAEPVTMVAGFDASAATNIFVVQDTNGKLQIPTANARAVGILTIGAPNGKACRVVIGGIAPVKVGTGGLAAGAFVATDGSGQAVTQSSTNPRLGICQPSPDGSIVTYAAGDIAPILFAPMP